jgi:hypothetical protein
MAWPQLLEQEWHLKAAYSFLKTLLTISALRKLWKTQVTVCRALMPRGLSNYRVAEIKIFHFLLG